MEFGRCFLNVAGLMNDLRPYSSSAHHDELHFCANPAPWPSSEGSLIISESDLLWLN